MEGSDDWNAAQVTSNVHPIDRAAVDRLGRGMGG